MGEEKTVCLCMIVRNEHHVIRRALESAKPWIQHWVICDTGSTDNTPQIITEVMQEIPGELIHRPWKNFGHNRGEVIAYARSRADYLLLMDADMVLNVTNPFRHKLNADAYEIRYEGDLDYYQWMLISSKHEWRYVGVTHEYIQAGTFQCRDWLPEVSLTHLEDGGMRADKFERDIELLSDALKEDPANPRSIFYLAQSYKDLDRYEEALIWYNKRAQITDAWEEERWYASFQAARMKLLGAYQWNEVRNDLLQAYESRPWRYEPLYLLIRYLREDGKLQAAYTYCAFVSNGINYPTEDTLFIEKTIYDYQLQLEYGICAYGTGRISEAIRAFSAVLKQPAISPTVRDSAQRGLNMATSDLYPPVYQPKQVSNRLVVIAAFRNAEDFLKRNLQSLIDQNYSNFGIIYIDDASDDGGAQILPDDNDQVMVIQNKARRGSAYNIHQAITNHCNPEDIVLLVDGDDWLPDNEVLSKVNAYYNAHECWVMYSQFQYEDGTRGFCEPFASPKDLLVQRAHWRTSHLKTFRAGLFQYIGNVDREYLCLKDEKGDWLQSAVDAAIMFPLIDLAGFAKVRFYDDILYVYNDVSENNHHSLNRENQIQNYWKVTSKRPFTRIQNYTQETSSTVRSQDFQTS